MLYDYYKTVVDNIKEGDVVCINPSRFAVKKHKEGSLKDGIITDNPTISYNFDIIEIALKRTTSKVNPSFDYIDKLLTDWHDRGFTTAEQVEKFLLDIKQKNKEIRDLEKSTKNYQNYNQRNYDNLNNLYANKL